MNEILDFAPPLVLAALGGVLSERAGVVNIGLEGMMRFGAFAAAAGAIYSGSAWFGLLCGALAGAASAAVHALLSLRFRCHVHLPFGMKPGMPVFTTSFSLCLI